MKLSKEYKDRIRLAYTGKLIEYIQSGKYEIFGKIKLDKDILEDLLFDTVKIKRKDISYTVKLPVWSGRFLEALDLSEVDFSDVSWRYVVKIIELILIKCLIFIIIVLNMLISLLK